MNLNVRDTQRLLQLAGRNALLVEKARASFAEVAPLTGACVTFMLEVSAALRAIVGSPPADEAKIAGSRAGSAGSAGSDASDASMEADGVERSTNSSESSVDLAVDCLRKMEATLQCLLSREPNYFSTFEPDPYVRELQLLQRALRELVPLLTSSGASAGAAARRSGTAARHGEASGGTGAQPAAAEPARPAADGRELLQRMASVDNPVSWLFWRMHFGRATEVRASELMDAFTSFYGPQPRTALRALQAFFVGAGEPGRAEDAVQDARAFVASASPGSSSSATGGQHGLPPLMLLGSAMPTPSAAGPPSVPRLAPAPAASEAMSAQEWVRAPVRPEPPAAPNAAPVPDEERTVTVATYSRAVQAHGGLFETYQAAASTGEVPLLMGLLDAHRDGHGRQVDVYRPLLGLQVVRLSCGGEHVAAATREGHVYTWGRGSYGRLGHGDGVSQMAPKLVQGLLGVDVSEVSCGYAFTVAVARSGIVYSWGAGDNGRLGHGTSDDHSAPKLIDSLRGVCRVATAHAGSVHTCLLTDDGQVYAFGRAEYVGLGSSRDVLTPRKISTFEHTRVVSLSVGPGGYHTLALTEEDKVYAWGHNRVGQLGLGNSYATPRNAEGAYYFPVPTPVTELCGIGVRMVVAGWGHSAAVTKSGILYMCGRNVKGQLGLGDPALFPQNERGHSHLSRFRRVEGLLHEKVTFAACGGEHTVAVVEGGQLYAWGAGEQGQLGFDATGILVDTPTAVNMQQHTGRTVGRMVCGHSCTLMLAGVYQPVALSEMCLQAITRNSRLCADVLQGKVGLVPQHLLDRLATLYRRRVDSGDHELQESVNVEFNFVPDSLARSADEQPADRESMDLDDAESRSSDAVAEKDPAAHNTGRVVARVLPPAH